MRLVYTVAKEPPEVVRAEPAIQAVQSEPLLVQRGALPCHYRHLVHRYVCSLINPSTPLHPASIPVCVAVHAPRRAAASRIELVYAD